MPILELGSPLSENFFFFKLIFMVLHLQWSSVEVWLYAAVIIFRERLEDWLEKGSPPTSREAMMAQRDAALLATQVFTMSSDSNSSDYCRDDYHGFNDGDQSGSRFAPEEQEECSALQHAFEAWAIQTDKPKRGHRGGHYPESGEESEETSGSSGPILVAFEPED